MLMRLDVAHWRCNTEPCEECLRKKRNSGIAGCVILAGGITLSSAILVGAGSAVYDMASAKYVDATVEQYQQGMNDHKIHVRGKVGAVGQYPNGDIRVVLKGEKGGELELLVGDMFVTPNPLMKSYLEQAVGKDEQVVIGLEDTFWGRLVHSVDVLDKRFERYNHNPLPRERR